LINKGESEPEVPLIKSDVELYRLIVIVSRLSSVAVTFATIKSWLKLPVAVVRLVNWIKGKVVSKVIVLVSVALIFPEESFAVALIK